MDTIKITFKALVVGDKVRVEKGLRDTFVSKGTSAQVVEIVEMGAEYNHNTKVVIRMLNGFDAGKTKVFYARHKNRLTDCVIRLSKGDPTKYIEVMRKS